MPLPIKPICDRRPNKDGTNLITIQYCHSSNRRTLLPTNIYIPYLYWNKKQKAVSKKLPPCFGEYNELNETILMMVRRVEDLIVTAKNSGHPDYIAFLKQHFDSSISIGELKSDFHIYKKTDGTSKQTNEPDFYFQIDDYITSKRDHVSKGMPRIYRNMKYHLQEFEKFRNKPITFGCLDFNFYEQLVNFLTNHYVQTRRRNRIVGLKMNTIGKTIKQFRTFLRNRIRKKIIAPIDMEGWTVIEEEVDAVYLAKAEIDLIRKCDLCKYPHLEYYRNDFILGCLTGLRYSDFSMLEQEDIKGDMLYKKQQKSNHWVVIPLKPAAQEILARRFDDEDKCPTNAEYNRHIKTIAKLAGITEKIKFSHKKCNKTITEVKPKYEWITTHTCRRSFCTNEFLSGTPVELIMKISGHKSVKDFYKYIRITPEEAGLKIKELWIRRGDMDFYKQL